MNKLTLSFLLFCFLFCTSGCQEIKEKDNLSRLNSTLLTNLKHLRWGAFRELKFLQTDEFQTKEIDFDFLEKIRVSHVSQAGFNVAEDNQSAAVYYAIEFYDLDTNKIRTISYQQTWVFFPKKRKWKLDSPMPDFKKAFKKKLPPKIRVQYL
jgi:hypothetical protein